jgi:hypothetical protein
MLELEVSLMDEAVPSQPTLKTRADYMAATDRCLEEMDRMHQQIARDLAEIERLRVETRAILDKLKAG